MNLPEHDRLPAALDMITDLMGGGVIDKQHWRQVLRIAPAPAVVFSVLMARRGAVVSRDSMAEAMEYRGYDKAGNIKIIDNYIMKIRRSLKRLGYPEAVKTRWGLGWALERDVADKIADRFPKASDPLPVETMRGVSEEPLARAGSPWSQDDDDDLRRMVRRGDLLSAIAYEMDRTERACLERARVLGLRGGIVTRAHEVGRRPGCESVNLHVPEAPPLDSMVDRGC